MQQMEWKDRFSFANVGQLYEGVGDVDRKTSGGTEYELGAIVLRKYNLSMIVNYTIALWFVSWLWNA